MTKLFLLSICLFSSISAHSNDQITFYDVIEADKVASQISERYPNANFEYVFVGRSLSLISAYLEEHGVLVTFLPLSNMRMSKAIIGNDPNYVSWLNEHFSRFLPHFPKKPLLLIDYADTGGGLKYTKKRVQDWYESVGVENVQIHALALSATSRLVHWRNGQSEVLIKKLDTELEHLEISYWLDEQLMAHKYRNFSKFFRFSSGYRFEERDHSTLLAPRREYFVLRSKVRHFMKVFGCTQLLKGNFQGEK